MRRFWILLAVAAVWLAWTFGARRFSDWQSERAHQARQAARYAGDADHGTEVKILHFYASRGELIDGDAAVLCYGVLNALSARIDPVLPSAPLSRNRCLEIRPAADTQYRLTATGSDGRTVSAGFEVLVRPDPDTRPEIVYFTNRRQASTRNVVGDAENAERLVHNLCFFAKNTERIAIDPPVFPPFAGIDGCFYVAPTRTTTYTLTGHGTRGRSDSKQLTITVP
jgi:hypothetical protein